MTLKIIIIYIEAIEKDLETRLSDSVNIAQGAPGIHRKLRNLL